MLFSVGVGVGLGVADSSRLVSPRKREGERGAGREAGRDVGERTCGCKASIVGPADANTTSRVARLGLRQLLAEVTVEDLYQLDVAEGLLQSHATATGWCLRWSAGCKRLG